MSLPPGRAPLQHPFTPFVLLLGVALLAMLLPGPEGPLALYAATGAALTAAGRARAVLRGAVVCLPLWLFLFLLHAVLGEGPRLALGPLSLSADGVDVALAQAGRLGAIVSASMGVLETFAPSRFLDAVAERGWRFHGAYLFVATLQALPRFRDRAAAIVEGQRSRGLRLGGGMVARARAVVPLALPLMLGALVDVEDRVIALETRAVHAGTRRTPLDPPPVRRRDRAWWAAAATAVVLALTWRLWR